MALSERSVVVTGATGNLGRTVVRLFLERGAHVACPVRDAAKGDELLRSLADRAGSADEPHLIVDTADPADAGAMERFVERVLRAWGRLDVLANLAGGYGSGGALDLAAMEALWATNVRTTVTATAACVRPMRARGHGRVVTVGSLSGLQGRKDGGPYAMAKGALIRWNESLAAELKDEGVTANVVLPSTIDHPENRARYPKADASAWVTPAELAAVILFLASDEASGVTGAAIPVTART